MAFEKCENPPRAVDLAISNGDTILDHDKVFNAQHRYWSRQQAKAEADVDLARHALAIGLHHELAKLSRNLLRDVLRGNTPLHFIERDRMRVIGTLALSILCRRVLKETDDIPLEDGIALGRTNMGIDMMGDEHDMPLEPRLHMMGDLADEMFPMEQGAGEAWFRGGQLYVRRTAVATPSEPFLLYLHAHNLSAPFPQMTTLYPYLATVHPA